jgi:hypothetical protein
MRRYVYGKEMGNFKDTGIFQRSIHTRSISLYGQFRGFLGHSDARSSLALAFQPFDRHDFDRLLPILSNPTNGKIGSKIVKLTCTRLHGYCNAAK